MTSSTPLQDRDKLARDLRKRFGGLGPGAHLLKSDLALIREAATALAHPREELEVGRVPAAPGSHPSGHAASGVDGASRFDPSRGDLERMCRALAHLPPDVCLVMDEMGDGEHCYAATDVAEITKVEPERVRQIHRALRTLGLADFGVLCNVDSDAYEARGSGYWLTHRGEVFRHALGDAIAMDARQGRDAQRLDGEAATARAEGIAQKEQP